MASIFAQQFIKTEKTEYTDYPYAFFRPHHHWNSGGGGGGCSLLRVMSFMHTSQHIIVH
jgi:hypothetical protein